MYRFILYFNKNETNYYDDKSFHTQKTEMDISGNILTNKEEIEFMKEIEQKTEKMVNHDATIYKTITNPINLISGAKVEKKEFDKSIDVLMAIMQQGANEFKEKTGRNMTYSEMRSIYG